MSLDYEKKYAYTEAYEIIKWLGKEYEEKLPRKVFESIKLERRLDYKPQIDFSKPTAEWKLREETKNIIAYLNLNFWCKDENVKAKIREKIAQNAEEKKKKEAEARKQEIARRAQSYTNVGVALDQALKNK